MILTILSGMPYSVRIFQRLGLSISLFSWLLKYENLFLISFQGVTIFKAVDQGPLEFDGKVYPDWANAMAWLVVAFPLAVILFIMVLQSCRDGGIQVSQVFN